MRTVKAGRNRTKTGRLLTVQRRAIAREHEENARRRPRHADHSDNAALIRGLSEAIASLISVHDVLANPRQIDALTERLLRLIRRKAK